MKVNPQISQSSLVYFIKIIEESYLFYITWRIMYYNEKDGIIWVKSGTMNQFWSTKADVGTNLLSPPSDLFKKRHK